jgi:hypothetical protein
MPGTNAGTGQPITFRCWVERRERWKSFRDDHVVTMTGRTRPYHGHTGGRMTTTAYEYRCSCGHVGWSAHVDAARLAARR